MAEPLTQGLSGPIRSESPSDTDMSHGLRGPTVLLTLRERTHHTTIFEWRFDGQYDRD